jgi:hypothetical protein
MEWRYGFLREYFSRSRAAKSHPLTLIGPTGALSDKQENKPQQPETKTLHHAEAA